MVVLITFSAVDMLVPVKPTVVECTNAGCLYVTHGRTRGNDHMQLGWSKGFAGTLFADEMLFKISAVHG